MYFIQPVVSTFLKRERYHGGLILKRVERPTVCLEKPSENSSRTIMAVRWNDLQNSISIPMKFNSTIKMLMRQLWQHLQLTSNLENVNVNLSV